MQFLLVLGLGVLLRFVAAQELEVVDSSLVNVEVERTLDFSSHLLKITDIISLENTGSSPAKSFLFFIEPTFENNLAYLEARVGNLNLCRFSQKEVSISN